MAETANARGGYAQGAAGVSLGSFADTARQVKTLGFGFRVCWGFSDKLQALKFVGIAEIDGFLNKVREGVLEWCT